MLEANAQWIMAQGTYIRPPWQVYIFGVCHVSRPVRRLQSAFVRARHFERNHAIWLFYITVPNEASFFLLKSTFFGNCPFDLSTPSLYVCHFVCVFFHELQSIGSKFVTLDVTVLHPSSILLKVKIWFAQTLTNSKVCNSINFARLKKKYTFSVYYFNNIPLEYHKKKTK